jgi:hypothetical protein
VRLRQRQERPATPDLDVVAVRSNREDSQRWSRAHVHDALLSPLQRGRRQRRPEVKRRMEHLAVIIEAGSGQRRREAREARPRMTTAWQRFTAGPMRPARADWKSPE